MNEVLVTFVIPLTQAPPQIESLVEVGPCFHRWLPDGQKDAISIPVEDQNADLKVWFDRRGFVVGGLIQYDRERKEVDPELMARQGKLQGGPLRGELKLRAVPDADIAGLVQDGKGAPTYVELGKRVVRALYAPLSRFMTILRVNYGQYWIAPLPEWDSRRESLGAYCDSLSLWWRLSGEEAWKPFRPERLRHTIEIRDTKYDEYLTEDDWRDLAELASLGYEPSLAAIAIAGCHEHLDLEDLRYAFVDGVLALELALEELFRSKVQMDKEFQDALQSFWQLPRAAQLTTAALLLGGISAVNLKLALGAVRVRDKVVHEGYISSDSDKKELSGLLRTVAKLVPNARFKFPTMNRSNVIYPPDG